MNKLGLAQYQNSPLEKFKIYEIKEVDTDGWKGDGWVRVKGVLLINYNIQKLFIEKEQFFGP